jgi:SET domain-containing protein
LGGKNPSDGQTLNKTNKASSDTRALPIERFKIMEKEIDIFGNVLMTNNSIMDGKFSVMDANRK